MANRKRTTRGRKSEKRTAKAVRFSQWRTATGISGESMPRSRWEEGFPLAGFRRRPALLFLAHLLVGIVAVD